MGRLSAAIGRLVASLAHGAEMQGQVYVDDVLLLIHGGRTARDNIVALVLYTLKAFGVRLALEKGERGTRAVWIGTAFELAERED